MKMSSKLEAIGNTAFNPMQIDRDNPEVMAKLAGILTTSNYGFPYSAIRELWLNARENEQDTIEFDGYKPEKTVITLPSRSVRKPWQQSGVNHQDGTIFGALEPSDEHERVADFTYGEQDWFVSVEEGSHEFSIRNYGRSMDSETARQRITGVGTSSKSEDDTRGGGMGIGIQSPLSITDMALFENFHNGTVTYLTIMRDENDAVGYGEPYTAETDEPDGMRVSFIINDGVRLESIIDDITRTFLLAGRSERLEVHADSRTVEDFREECNRFVWLNDEREYGWNFAIYRGYLTPFSDSLMIDGCMYRYKDATQHRMLDLKNMIATNNENIRIIGVYNARVGEFKVTGSREYVRDFDKSLEYKDYPEEIRDVEDIFANAVADNSDETKSLFSLYAEAISSVIEQLDDVDTDLSREISKIVRNYGLRTIKLAEPMSVDVESMPVKIVNGDHTSVRMLTTSGMGASIVTNPQAVYGEPEKFVALRGEEPGLSIKSIRSRMVRMNSISYNFRSIVSHMESMDLSASENVIELLHDIANSDGSNINRNASQFAIKVSSAYKTQQQELADGVKLSTLDVVEYPEIDEAIKNIRAAWKALGYAPERSNAVRNEARYDVLLYTGEGSPFEGDHPTHTLTVTELAKFLDDDAADEEDKRIVVLEDDAVGLRSHNIIRNKRLAQHLFSEYGYSVYVSPSKRAQKIQTMADRLATVWPETYYVSEDELYDREEYASAALDELEAMDYDKDEESLFLFRGEVERVGVDVTQSDDMALIERWQNLVDELKVVQSVNMLNSMAKYHMESVSNQCEELRDSINSLTAENKKRTNISDAADSLDEILGKMAEVKELFAKIGK